MIFAVTSVVGQDVVVRLHTGKNENFLDGFYLTYRTTLYIQRTFASKYDIKTILAHFDRL